MDIQATHKNARMTPRKLRYIARLLPGMGVKQAGLQLQYYPGKAAGLINQVLESAVANAVHNHELDANSLVVRNVIVNPGFVMKRVMPAPKGVAHPILKRNAHVTVIVGEADGTKVKKGKKAKAEIATITAEEYATQHADHEEPLEEAVADTKEVKEKGEVREGMKNDKQMEAFQKVKINQQGGDSKAAGRKTIKKSGHK